MRYEPGSHVADEQSEQPHRLSDFHHVDMTSGRVVAVSPVGVARGLLIITSALVAANVMVQVLRYPYGLGDIHGLADRFDLNGEGNLPAYFSGALLLTVSALLLLISKKAATYRRRWAFLSLVFLYLSIDELTYIHEMMSAGMARIMNIEGIGRYYLWVLPFSMLLAGLTGAYVHFLWKLPSRFQRLFVASGSVYVAGALGLEMVSAWHGLRYGVANFGHAIIYTVEETLEMCGLILFIFALLTYLGECYRIVQIRFDDPFHST